MRTIDVASGDTLSRIAREHQTSVEALLDANPQIRDADHIRAGDELRVPGTVGRHEHTVKQGETLSTIGRRYGVGGDALLRANPQIRHPDLIYPGQRVDVPGLRTHTVRPGETLGAIAGHFDTSVAAIARANDIRDPDLIYPHDRLVIPNARPAPAADALAPARPQAPGAAPTSPGGTGNPPSRSDGRFDYDQIQNVRGNPNVTPAFTREVEAMAKRLDTRPEYLMAVMSFESGLDPKARNPISSASGLIQFMDGTAPGLGTSIEAIRGMNAMQQLPYVEKYFDQYKGKLGSLEGVYTAVLSGKAHSNPADTLFSQGTDAYASNRGLDFDQDGRITAGEATSAVASRLYGGVRHVQQRLVRTGAVPQAQQRGFADGQFGPHTSAAIRRFQQSHGLNATGLLDEATGRKLFAGGASRPDPQDAPAGGEVRRYDPYTVYSGGRAITGAAQLAPHHDYQSQQRSGQTLEVRDVTLAHGSQSRTTQAIPSPVTGTVVEARPMGTAGNAVILRSEDGGRVYLFHLSRVDVKPGDKVNYGDRVGLQGSTGHSTGPHVHIEAAPATVRHWIGDLLDGSFDRR